jgi:ubiquinone/menaquinone biosynthesis C-methylase UbiE
VQYIEISRMVLWNEAFVMSTFVLMRILESAPERYDTGIWLLTLGTVGRAYNRLAANIQAGQQVLDIGCGTGAFAIRAARRGATVKAIDINSHMLEIAHRRANEAELSARISFHELGVAELDAESSESFDIVTSGLCFSELSEDELRFTLKHVLRVLKPGGLLLVADEVRPRNPVMRAAKWLLWLPFAAITYLLTQQTTHSLRDLDSELAASGLRIVSMQSGSLRSLCEVVAARPGRDQP